MIGRAFPLCGLHCASQRVGWALGSNSSIIVRALRGRRTPWRGDTSSQKLLQRLVMILKYSPEMLEHVRQQVLALKAVLTQQTHNQPARCSCSLPAQGCHFRCTHLDSLILHGAHICTLYCTRATCSVSVEYVMEPPSVFHMVSDCDCVHASRKVVMCSCTILCFWPHLLRWNLDVCQADIQMLDFPTLQNDRGIMHGLLAVIRNQGILDSIPVLLCEPAI
jgi:hypothetical protein